MKMRSTIYIGFGTAVTIWACDMPTSHTCMEAHNCPRGGAAGATGTDSGIGGVSSATTVNGQGGAIGTETYAGGSGGALPCNGTCGGLTPICDAAKNKCVSCTANSNCTVAPLNVCDASSASCVECVGNADCKSGDKHACKMDTKSCVECVVNADCTEKVTLQGIAGATGTAGAS
ncbi:MAG TPA: hypothetical protein VKP30_16140, partial [Polyangiaceae bacterium]|nr:hypothetical protein [Polyangiaceae bacterium]